ncbi:hypothetical protein [Bremerella sp. P1]|uniref:hypothetical protein n=1 Tax=Bremerella sp. P1 TaxID=3026424 RepID=UPI002368A588|nr:hypothetical protein [Bremerella sp. P1]WDI42120.1 hypothetical protein PSR63_27075 [Bremerella sp. P1]
MTGRILLSISFCILLTGTAHAAESVEKPSIEQLFAGTPVISPKVEDIQQFSFSFEITANEATVLRGHYYWQRGEPGGFYFSTDEHEAPVWFVANETAMLFDIVEQELALIPHAQPFVKFGIEGDRVSFNYGIEFVDHEEITTLNIQSFSKTLAESQSLTRNGAGNWVVQADSSTGKSVWKMTFAARPPYAPREIVSHTRQGDKNIAMRFTHIRVNEPPDNPWPQMPLKDQWPDGLTPRNAPSADGEDTSDWISRAFRILTTHMAIDNEAIRNPVLRGNLNWDQIRQIRDHYGPRLRHLIGFHEPVE